MLRAGRRAPAHRPRDARSVRRAVDRARPRHRRAQGRVRRRDRRCAARSTRSRAVAQQLDRDVDHLVWELRPTALDDLGLRAALANYVQDWSKRVSISAELHTSGLLDDRLAVRGGDDALSDRAGSADQRRQALRAPTHVDVILERRADHVLLIVEDDGVGFDPSATRHAGRRASVCSACRNARRWSARRSRSNRRRARARRSSCGWRCRRASDATIMPEARRPAAHPAGRRSRDRPSRPEAAHRQPARHEGRRRGERRRRRRAAARWTQAGRHRDGHLDAGHERARRHAHAEDSCSRTRRSSR